MIRVIGQLGHGRQRQHILWGVITLVQSHLLLNAVPAPGATDQHQRQFHHLTFHSIANSIFLDY